jgi:hypothetical protein
MQMFFNYALKRLCPLTEGQYSVKRYRNWGKDTNRRGPQAQPI